MMINNRKRFSTVTPNQVSTVKAQDNSNKCTKHKTKQIDWVCIDTKCHYRGLCCTLCLYESHKQHKDRVIPLEVFFEQLKAEHLEVQQTAILAQEQTESQSQVFGEQVNSFLNQMASLTEKLLNSVIAVQEKFAIEYAQTNFQKVMSIQWMLGNQQDLEKMTGYLELYLSDREVLRNEESSSKMCNQQKLASFQEQLSGQISNMQAFSIKAIQRFEQLVNQRQIGDSVTEGMKKLEVEERGEVVHTMKGQLGTPLSSIKKMDQNEDA